MSEESEESGRRTGPRGGAWLALLAVAAVAVAGLVAWRVVFAADPSGGTAAPPPAAAPGTTEAAAPGPPTGGADVPADRGTPRPSGPVARVVYLGDSLAMENQDALADRLGRSGRAVLRPAPHSGTTLCDYLQGRRERSLVPDAHKAAALVRAERPAAVVLQFWGNSWGYTPCMGTIGSGTRAYYERYAADARALTAQIAAAAKEAGIARPRLVWVLQGPDAMAPDRIRRVNELYRAQAKAAGDLVADAGAAVGPEGSRYTFAERVPCTAAERAHPTDCAADGTARLHRADDPLHFCLAPTTAKSRPCPVRSPGIVRFTGVVAGVVERAVTARSPGA